MSEITLLDGGMGQELIHRTGDNPTPLWSTQALIDRPGLVAEVHRDYRDAGATVATTNTYALHRDRLRGGASNHYASDDIDIPNMEHRFEAFLEAALTEAEAVKGPCRIAGSIGPLVASYRADLHPQSDIAVPQFAEIAAILAPRVDVILFETVPSCAAGRDALAATEGLGVPVWLSFTVDDDDGSRLRSGEPVADAAEVAQGADAVLINCSAPEVMPAALRAMSSAGVPMGAYANGFETLTKEFVAGGATASTLSARRDMGPEVYADHALAWVDQGATIIGGCCETSPAHIAEIAKRLRSAGHSIV